MTMILVGKSGTQYPEGVFVPMTDIPTEAFRQRGYDFTEELAIRDEALGWPAPWARRKWRVRCLTCTHHPRAKQMVDRDGWICRWGHITTYFDMIKAGLR